VSRIVEEYAGEVRRRRLRGGRGRSRRGPNGCRIVVHTAGRHTLADVVADLLAFAEKLKGSEGQERAA
jgi:hypothetical protein